MIIFFRLSNIPNTFQRYINWILKNYLNNFCSVYLNDILIFSKDSLRQYKKHVYKILDKLKKARLHLDINKCEFKTASIKYLNFIIKAEKGIHINPNKIKTIRE